MSKFNFAKLREQIVNTNQSLKETFKTTDARMQGNERATETRKNNPELWRKQKSAMKEIQKDPEYRKAYLKGNSVKYQSAEYWDRYYAAIAKRDSNPDYHARRIAASNAVISIKISTPKGEFNSISDAARHYGMTSEGMRHRVNSDKYPDFKKIQK